MLIKIRSSEYVNLEEISRILFHEDADPAYNSVVIETKTTGVTKTYDQGVIERLRFFLDEVFSSSVIDLEKVYEKKEEILAAKQIMKDKIEELRAKAEQATPEQQQPAGRTGLFIPTGPGNQIVRASDGKPLKNLFVMPPPNKKGGPSGNGNAA